MRNDGVSGRPIASTTWGLLATALAFTAWGCGWIDEAAAKDTKLIVFAPEGPASVVIDGGAPRDVSQGKFAQFPVGPGTHTVQIDGASVHSVTLEPFDRWVVPARPDQCFTSMDVSLSHYEGVDAPPLLTGRTQSSTPFKFPAGNYLRESDLPKSRRSGERTLLFRSAPCATLDELEAAQSK